MAKIVDEVRRAARKRVLFLPHAVKQMSRPDRLIRAAEVQSVVLGGELVEDYPDDPRGHSCLLLGTPDERPVHVVCSPKADYLAIITAYVPDSTQWSPDFRRRVT
jgi:hypothetical protein